MSQNGQLSGALRLTDLNDYISPGLECIKPLEEVSSGGKGIKEITVDADGGYVQVSNDGSQQALKEASITLNDCLACSGCITSAESVLVSAQSLDEFERVLDAGDKHIVVSVAPQARASLANHYGLSSVNVLGAVTAALKEQGVQRLFDTTFTRDLAIVEACRTFVRRYEQDMVQLPMLESSCPGWICYAEKKHGEFVLPYISSVKSPQQIMGSLVKDAYATSLGLTADQVYHVALMPCYDKKLEASRADFYNQELHTRDVDCVLTTGELVDFLNARGYAPLKPVADAELDTMYSAIERVDALELDEREGQNEGEEEPPYVLYGNAGTSGSYLEEIMLHAARELFGANITEEDLEYSSRRNNKDFVEVVWKQDGEVKLRFARAYGFRNIQNLIRKMKNGQRKAAKKSLSLSSSSSPVYHYVEVMACPSGCLNGGGQAKPSNMENAELDSVQVLKKLKSTYESGEGLVMRRAMDNDAAMALYDEWLGGHDSAKAQRMLHTEYHAIQDTFANNPLLTKW